MVSRVSPRGFPHVGAGMWIEWLKLTTWMGYVKLYSCGGISPASTWATFTWRPTCLSINHWYL